MATTKWAFDPTHSELGFKIKHLMITNVSGAFKKFDVIVEIEGENFSTAQIEAKADMSSIYTSNEQRDVHLRNADFFEVEKYPELIFQSTRIEKVNHERFDLYGTLRMKGVTRPVKLDVEYSGITNDPWGNERAGFTISGKIKRTDWGVSFNALTEAGGVVLSEEVKIHSEIQLIKVQESIAI